MNSSAALKAFFLVFLIGSRLPVSAQPVPDSGYYRSFDGVRIHYETFGRGRPVLLLHGFMGSGESWKKAVLFKMLPDSGYRVILVDLRGNGRSDKPHTQDAYRNDAETRDIKGLMDFLQIPAYDLLGYSRGAIIAARVLCLDPRVQKAVIGGMGDAFTDSTWALPKALYRSLVNAPDSAFAGMKANVRKQGLDSIAQGYLQNQQPFTMPAELARVNKPVLLLRGDKDTTNGSTPALQKMIPGAKYELVPGDHGGTAGTLPFAEKVLAFLKQK